MENIKLNIGEKVTKKGVNEFIILDVLKHGYLVKKLNGHDKSAYTVHFNYFNC